MADIKRVKIGNTTYDIAAKKLANTMRLSLTGGVTGYVDFDGSGSVSLATTLSSHTHDDRYYTESEIDAKVSALNTSISGVNSKITAFLADATISDAAIDTLKEIQIYIDEDEDNAAAMLASINNNASNLSSHTSNKNNPHGVTLTQLGVTATATELNYVDGVTSNIQTQLNGKQASGSYVSRTDTGVQTIAGGLVIGKTSTTGVSGTGVGRIMFTGQSNPLIGLQSIDGSGTALDPWYFQALSNNTMCIGPTSTKALSFDRNGNMTSPSSLTIGGSISEGGTTLSSKYAAKSHGNHVPATETANNAKFLRNDNTWQTVTPANIGAAASSHGTHVTYGTSASALGTSSAGSASSVSRSDHVHALPALTSCTGTLTVAKGGTGATTADSARVNMKFYVSGYDTLPSSFSNGTVIFYPI